MASTSQKSCHDTQSARTDKVQFDYENIKKQFYLDLNRLCPKTVNLANPSWASVIKFIINAIMEGKKKEENNEKVEHFAECAMKTYDVIEIEGKRVLALKEIIDGEPIVVVPNEECFDLLTRVHLQKKHADYKNMISFLKHKYLISEKNVSLFLKLCNVCNNPNPNQKREPVIVNHSYYIFFINLLEFQDEPYGYLLTLVEKSSNFFILRPLVIKSPSEIAVELLKVFADFGPPVSIFTNEPDFFISANIKISQMCPEFNIQQIEMVLWDELKNFDKLVKREICEWISMTGCINWSTGCRMVQWRINNIETDNKTPFESLFGVRPNDSLYSNPVWLRVSDGNHETTSNIVGKFKKSFRLEERAKDVSSGIIVNVKTEGVKQGEKDPNNVIEGEDVRCFICLHPAYRVSFCTTCKNPMHSFCGTRFVGRSSKIYNLCVKCKINK